MAHQLYVLQVLTFNLLEERMMTKMDPNDQVKKIVWQVIGLCISILPCNLLTHSPTLLSKIQQMPFKRKTIQEIFYNMFL